MAHDDQEFQAWFKSVDWELKLMSGIGCNDLADREYRGAFDSGIEPREFAREILENEGFFDDDESIDGYEYEQDF
jgi:hypothetical protein